MFWLRKITHAFFILIGVILLVFILFRKLGDPSRMIAGQTGDKKTIENIRKELHLDQPSWKQFLFYTNDLSPISFYSIDEIQKKEIDGLKFGGDYKLVFKFPYLGKSYQSKKPVGAIISDALPGTIILALAAMLLACFLGVIIGVIAALNKDSWLDSTLIFTSIAGISAPTFFIAIIVAYVFGIWLHQYTGLNFNGSLYEIDEITGEKFIVLKNLILPAITLGIRPLSIITQLTRSSMLDVLSEDYIRTAYAKGLKKSDVIFKHAIRNALNPVITAVTGWFAELLAGAFFIEYIFGWKGLGKVTIDALDKLDFPVVSGAVLCSATIFILFSIISDYLHKTADPRIH